MSVGSAIYSLLNGNGTVAGLVGTKIYPNYAPQSTVMPMLVYVVLSSDPEDTKDLTGDVEDIRVQINILTRSYAEIETIYDAVKSVLNRYSGTSGSIKFQTITYDGHLDVPSELDDIYQRAMDFKVRRYI